MFIRGSGSGSEYKRIDESFYKGIVIKNDDPLKLNRVKVYIPEISNQFYDDWLEKYDSFNCKAPGLSGDSWYDTDIFHEMSTLIPWADACYGLFGESGNFRYFKDGENSTISDGNYTEGFFPEDEKLPPSSAPSKYLNSNRMLDAFSSPVANSSVKNNPYGFCYNPSDVSNKAKGLFGIPEIGSKVWVFHYRGDANYPVYFGVYRDYRELALINNTDNDDMLSQTYPNNFEN